MTNSSSIQSSLLSGKALVWNVQDKSGISAAVAHRVLQESLKDAPVRVIRRKLDPQDRQTSGLQVGLTLWRLEKPNELAAICDGIRTFQPLDGLRSNRAVCVVFIEPEFVDCTGILLESGAQIVVRDVPSLESVLRQLVAPLASTQPGENRGSLAAKSVEVVPRRLPECTIPLSTRGFHPLTSGLVDRLPWPELESDGET